MRRLLGAGLLLLAAAGSARGDECAPIERSKALELVGVVRKLVTLSAEVTKPSMRTLDTAKGMPATFRSAAPRLQCAAGSLEGKERADAAALAQQAAKRADELDMAIAAEEKTRNAIVLPLCEATWGAQNEEAIIAREKSNPSGVVDLRVLHDAGDALRDYRQQIAGLKPLYKKARGRDFIRWQDEGACVEEANKPE